MFLFLTQFKFELTKMLLRKRTYVGFVAFFLMELLILFMSNLPGPRTHFQRMVEHEGYGVGDYDSGYTLALQIVTYSVHLLGSLYVALIGGDLVAKEIEDGTMRMLLCRPVTRVRVAMLKYLSALAYCFVLIGFISLTALAAGLAFRGPGGFFVFGLADNNFALIPADKALSAYLSAIPLLALAMTPIACLGFLFSCCNMKPATATIVTVSIVVLDFIFYTIPYFESLHPYFITTHMGAWNDVFLPIIPWPRMVEDFSYLLGLDVTCLILGTAVFLRRDLK